LNARSGRGLIEVHVQVSFVLVNYRVGREVLECLRSLEAVRSQVECEFVVVDNSAPEVSGLLAGKDARHVRVIPNPQNRGYGAACNIGAREARAPYVWFLNPDVQYREGSAAEILAWMERNPSVSLLGPRILNPDGSRQFSCRSFPGWRAAVAHPNSILARAFPSNPLTSSYLKPNLNGSVTQVDWASGCCLLARKSAFEAAGGFDEEYFLFFEDVDLAHRMKRLGLRCVYYPDVAFTHDVGSSRSYLPDQGRRAKHASARRYFTQNMVRTSALAKICGAAISLRGFFSEQYHGLGRCVTPPTADPARDVAGASEFPSAKFVTD
jgi:GT2 family glycosyltransferase